MVNLNLVIENSEVERLNSWLKREFKTIENVPLFRLVWSDKVFENRFGTYNDFTDSGLFIRQKTEVRRVKKYSYIRERWILEKWAPGSLTANRETPDAFNGDYIPVYVFEDSKGKFLPPTERAVKFIVDFTFGKIKQDSVPSEEYLAEKEVQNQIDSMDDHPSHFQTRPGDGRNAVGYSKNLKGRL